MLLQRSCHPQRDCKEIKNEQLALRGWDLLLQVLSQRDGKALSLRETFVAGTVQQCRAILGPGRHQDQTLQELHTPLGMSSTASPRHQAALGLFPVECALGSLLCARSWLVPPSASTVRGLQPPSLCCPAAGTHLARPLGLLLPQAPQHHPSPGIRVPGAGAQFLRSWSSSQDS